MKSEEFELELKQAKNMGNEKWKIIWTRKERIGGDNK